jgi:hypothetical protein
MERKPKTFWAGVTLFLLAPVCGELLSGSAPPREFFDPMAFVIMTALYGSGAVLIRELVRRWDKGWLAVFALGLAYGIYEEGLVVRSFFDPTWHDLDLLAVYGRFAGVNWIWSVCLSIYHAVVSIAIPILLVEMTFPKIRARLWVSTTGLVGIWLLFLTLIPVSFLFDMKASLLQIGVSVLLIVLLIGAAYLPWKAPEILQADFKAAPPWLAGLLGLFGMLGLFLVMWIFPALNIPWVIDLILALLLPLVFITCAFIAGAQNWDDRHGWAAAFGALLPWLGLTVVAELTNASRSDDTTGMIWVGVLFLVALVALRLFIHHRRHRNTPAVRE